MAGGDHDGPVACVVAACFGGVAPAEAVAGEVMVTYAQIQDTFSQKEAALFMHHPKAIHEKPVYLLLSKKVAESEAMLERFNDGLRQLKASGRYDQIIADALAGKYAKPN